MFERILFVPLFVFALLGASTIAAPRLGAQPPAHHSHSGTKAVKPHNSDNKVHVHGYAKKDGTYVHPYTRSYPHSKKH